MKEMIPLFIRFKFDLLRYKNFVLNFLILEIFFILVSFPSDEFNSSHSIAQVLLFFFVRCEITNIWIFFTRFRESRDVVNSVVHEVTIDPRLFKLTPLLSQLLSQLVLIDF